MQKKDEERRDRESPAAMDGWKLKDTAYVYHATDDTIHEVVVARFNPGRVNQDTKTNEPITYWHKDEPAGCKRYGHAPLRGKLFHTMEGAWGHRKEVIEDGIKGVETIDDLLDFIQARLHCALSNTNRLMAGNEQTAKALLPGSVILDPFTKALIGAAMEKIKKART